MNPNTRKNLLMAVAGVVLALIAADWLWRNAVEGPTETRQRRLAGLRRAVQERENALTRARKASDLLARWEAQSLPSDPEVARSLYQAWLLELVGYVGLGNPNVDSGSPVSRKGLYQTISFSVRGRGTLDQLTTFLFEFYSADHLHQIRSLSITPLSKSDQLDLSVSIETIVLPTATRRDRLSTERSARLASERLEDYAPIVRRNLFGFGGNPDPTDYTYLTTVVYVDDEPEAWFTLRSTDEVLKLRRGESLEIGQFRGTLREIREGDVVLESEGERWLLSIGENLAQAYALPPRL